MKRLDGITDSVQSTCPELSAQGLAPLRWVNLGSALGRDVNYGTSESWGTHSMISPQLSLGRADRRAQCSLRAHTSFSGYMCPCDSSPGNKAPLGQGPLVSSL